MAARDLRPLSPLHSSPLFFRFNRLLEMNFSSRDGRRFFLPPTTGQRSCVLALVTAISWTWRNITKGEAKHEKVARGTLVVRLGRRSGEMDRGSPMGIRYTRITGCVINRCKRWRHESLPIWYNTLNHRISLSDSSWSMSSVTGRRFNILIAASFKILSILVQFLSYRKADTNCLVSRPLLPLPPLLDKWFIS